MLGQTRARPEVDFGRLEPRVLWNYISHHDIPAVEVHASKDELVNICSRHFAGWHVDEDVVVRNFFWFRSQAGSGTREFGGGAHKYRKRTRSFYVPQAPPIASRLGADRGMNGGGGGDAAAFHTYGLPYGEGFYGGDGGGSLDEMGPPQGCADVGNGGGGGAGGGWRRGQHNGQGPRFVGEGGGGGGSERRTRFAEPEQIAAKGEQVAVRSAQHEAWILASVVRYLPSRHAYEVRDADMTASREKMEVKVDSVLLLTKSTEHLSKGTHVLARYPETTTFYPGKVTKPVPHRASLTEDCTVSVQFEDDKNATNGKTPHRLVQTTYAIPFTEAENAYDGDGAFYKDPHGMQPPETGAWHQHPPLHDHAHCHMHDHHHHHPHHHHHHGHHMHAAEYDHEHGPSYAQHGGSNGATAGDDGCRGGGGGRGGGRGGSAAASRDDGDGGSGDEGGPEGLSRTRRGGGGGGGRTRSGSISAAAAAAAASAGGGGGRARSGGRSGN